MNKIYTNINNQTLNISKNQTLEKTKINKELNKTNDENMKCNDTIVINGKNENIINKKKRWILLKIHVLISDM
ncbi:hypothetical protein [Clostridium sporogenes]|uniref:hypothetical protein n=1 Tax=Clostridium sporogenes TaxID=1509 RepID=UPI00223860F8|nr:hypothetical protein [Clostridium sporogenes]MCW6077972.1 hypothetical protein [Clostridium sporogenes]